MLNKNWNLVFYILIILSLILTVLIIYYYYNSEKNSTVYKANRENISKNSINKIAELILFSVDWCHHCKTAKPEWEKLKAQYEGTQINNYTLIFTEHNCTGESPQIEELMNKYKIEGYPTIKLLKDDQIIEYDAKPTKSTMEQFLNTVL